MQAESSDTLTVRDNRTGRTYELDIRDGAIRATDLKQIKVDDADHGLMTYDPGLVNTAITLSNVTYLDGEAGILQYRGYPIEQLAESCTYLEVACLLIYGRLPSQTELEEWARDITVHTFVHENIKFFMRGFRYDAHPMGMLLASVATELEKRALDDEYFMSRRLYPNVDFYSGLIYQALGLPMTMFPVLFAIPRTSGWIAQWYEMLHDPEQKIVRPLQIYQGDRDLSYHIASRGTAG